MSYIHPQAARREAFYRVSETCPKVKDELESAITKYLNTCGILVEDVDIDSLAQYITSIAIDVMAEHGTSPLREALIECEMERLVAQDKLSDLEGEVSSLQSDLRSTEDELAEALNRLADEE